MRTIKLGCEESLQVDRLLTIIFILILAMLFIFRIARHRSRVGVMETGIVTEEWVVPGRQSSLYFVFAFFQTLFPNCKVFCLFVVEKLYGN